MPADDFEATEDPLRNPKFIKIIDDEEEECGAGVDYRRMFKGKDKKKFQKIPKRGEKDFEPDGTIKQRTLLQEGRDAMYEALSFDAGLKTGAACGVWIEEYAMTHVPRNLCTGPWFQNTGFGSSTGHWLLPEETLLMVSSGRIELLDEDGFAMGVLGAWGACIESAGGVNAYLVYSQLRRAGYNVFRPGLLKDKQQPPLSPPLPVLLEKQPHLDTDRQHFLRKKWSQVLVLLTSLIFCLYGQLLSVLRYLPTWLGSRAYRPYDAVYSTLPPISSFSEYSSTTTTADPLTVAFEVWRPNPLWKRKNPGHPDFHICVVDAREQFPSLVRLEYVYNTIAQTHPLGGKFGRVVIAVVDRVHRLERIAVIVSNLQSDLIAPEHKLKDGQLM